MILPQYTERVEPNTQAAPNFQTGSPVAQAGEQLGRQIEGVGGQMQEFAHQEKVKANTTVVRDVYVNFSKEIIDLESDGLRKKGKDALDLEPYGQKFTEIIGKYKGQLKNADQIRMFENQTKMEEIRFYTSLHRHAAVEGDNLNKDNAKAQTEMDEQKLSLGYQDPANYDTKNPLSLMSKFLVSVHEQLKSNGVPEDSPEYKEEMFNANSKAFTDRAKLMRADNPSEALKFVTEHKSEIATKDYESLEKSLKHGSEEKQGLDASFSYLSDIANGKKTETEITKELHDKFIDNPGAFKVAQAEVNHLFAQNHADQVNAAAGVGTKIEAAIGKAVGNGQGVSLKLLKSIPEYNDLEKLAASGNKSAETELDKMKSYVSKTEHMQKQERKADASEAKRQQVIDRQNFMLDISDPQTLRTMTETQIREAGREHGLRYAQINQLVAERKKNITDSQNLKMMHHEYIQNSFINSIMESANIKDDEQRKTFGKAYRSSIKAKEDELGRPLTDDELKEQGIKGLQFQAGKKGFLGFGSKKGEWTMGGQKTSQPYPDDFISRVKAVETKRKITMSDKQKQLLYDEYQKEKL